MHRKEGGNKDALEKKSAQGKGYAACLLQLDGQVYSGRLLMQGGLLVQRMDGDFQSLLFHLVQNS